MWSSIFQLVIIIFFNDSYKIIFMKYDNRFYIDLSTAGFQAGPYFPNFPYFFTAALIFLIKASKS